MSDGYIGVPPEDRKPLFVLDNPYGYRTNLLNPSMAAMYEKFKEKKKIPYWCPLSDAERKEFDDAMIRYCYDKMPDHLKPKEREAAEHEKSA